MSKHQEFHPSKHALSDSKSRLSEKSEEEKESDTRRISDTARPIRRRSVSRASIVPSGSRLYFYRRGDRMKIPRYQNTYRLEPFRRFNPEAVDKLLREIMEKKLSDVTYYYPEKISRISEEIMTDVSRGIHKKDYDRCKFVVQVNVIQRLHQGFHAGFECLWDPERDNYSYFVFENCYIHAWCVVFGIYYE